MLAIQTRVPLEQMREIKKHKKSGVGCCYCMNQVLYDNCSLLRWRRCLPIRRCLRRLLLCLFLFLLRLTIFPRPSIAQATPTNALTRSSKLLWQVLNRDLCQEFILISRIKNVDLVDRDLIEPPLDHGPNGRERPRRIDDEESAHDLRIAILPDPRGCHHVVLDAVKVGKGDALQVQDRAECLDWVSDCARGGRHAIRYRTLVLADQSVKQSLLRRDGIERFEVQLAKLLNVDRATILEKGSELLPEREVKTSFFYLVDLVIILRVILVYLFLLRKFKRPVAGKKRNGFSKRPR